MSSEKQLPREQTAGAKREADVYDLLAWLEVNKTKVITIALALVVLGFVIATMRYMSEQKEIKASGELLALRATLTQPTNVPPIQPSEFLKVAQNFSGTSASERARMLAATAFFTQGNYSEAETEFAKFAREHSGSPWAASAAYGVAASQEAQNKPDAVASYQNVATAYPNSPVADEAKVALARIHETRGEPEQALRIYNEVLAPKPGTAPGMPGNPEAESRKEALLRAHPQLDTNVASTATITPVPVITPGAAPTLQLAPAEEPAPAPTPENGASTEPPVIETPAP